MKKALALLLVAAQVVPASASSLRGHAAPARLPVAHGFNAGVSAPVVRQEGAPALPGIPALQSELRQDAAARPDVDFAGYGEAVEHGQADVGPAGPGPAAEPSEGKAKELSVSGRRIAAEIGVPDYIKRGEDGLPVAVPAVQSLDGVPMHVLVGAGGVKQGPAYTKPDINTISTAELFSRPVNALVFGVPNMAIMMRDNLFSAYFYYRKKAELVSSKKIQAGLYAVMPSLTPEQEAALNQAAEGRVGKKGLTCVNQACRAMGDAGFSIGWRPMWSYFFPNGVLMALRKHGLKHDGRPVAVDYVSMRADHLEELWKEIRRSIPQSFKRLKERNKRAEEIKAGTAAPVADPAIAGRAPQFLESFDPALAYKLKASRPSILGARIRRWGGTHTIFKVVSDESPAARALLLKHFGATKLEAFPDTPEKPLSASSKLKKYVLFNRAMVGLLNFLLRSPYQGAAAQRDQAGRDYSLGALYTMMAAEPVRYNLVIRDSGVTVARLEGEGGSMPRLKKILDWVLAKHVLLSAYSDRVRFAGEVWKDEKGVIHVSGNSGTYKPEKWQVDAALGYLKEVFPGVAMVPEYAN